ncbi:MAG: rhomboid family intramembrane serine protease [Flavobacteriales bacterium]
MDFPIVSYTNLIILVTVVVSLIAYERKHIFVMLSFQPYFIKRNPKEAIRFITCAFVHADIFHLFFNMYVLYSFGNPLEYFFKSHFDSRGIFIYSLLYFGGALFSGLPGFARHKDNPAYLSIGASGAVSALVFSYIVLNPDGGMGIIFLPIFIPALYFGLIYLAIEYYLDKRGGSRIAHDAHFWGAIFGVVFTLFVDTDFAVSFIEQVKQMF